MEGEHVNLGLWTSTEESLSFVCSCAPSLSSIYYHRRSKHSKREEGLVNERSAPNPSYNETAGDQGRSNENEDSRRANNSATIQREMPNYPPPTYSASNEVRVVVRECTEQNWA